MNPIDEQNEVPTTGLPVPVPKMVGVVYKADGTPRIEPGWIESLSEEEVPLVAANLAAHGFDIADFTKKEIN